MNDTYDAVVCGSGLTECLVSGLLSTSNLKVLHLDRNNYYGGESASLNIEQIFKKFKGDDSKPDESLGRSRDYNVDLIPKFLMANGKLVKILRITGVTKYNMEFMVIEGSYVYRKNGKIYKVPATPTEAATSSLLGFFEKGRCKKLLSYVQSCDSSDEKTWSGHDLNKMTMEDLYKKFGVGADTIDFLGHAAALYTNDDYLTQPALETVERLRLYSDSLAMYGKSPYIYPLYGLGELPQVFARLCAVYGGTYMLSKDVDKFHYDEQGVVNGVESGGETAKCKFVVGDPSYFPDKVRKTGKVIRVICIVDHPIGGLKLDSAQIIIPQKQTGRKHDIYVCYTSAKHNVCPKGKYIAIVSTTVETDNPESEVKVGLDLIGNYLEKFVHITDTYEPLEDGTKDKVFISKSYDATTHFETCCSDAVSIYERITGKKFDWSKKLETVEQSQ